MRRFARRTAPLAALAAAVLVSNCAKIEAPSGGPEDKTAPRLLYTTPPDTSGRVPRDLHLVLGFSEKMDQQSVEDWIIITPSIQTGTRQWTGPDLAITFRAPLDTTVTYAVLVGTGAKDRRGNVLAEPHEIIFSAAEHPVRGSVVGTLEAVKQKASGVLVWAYNVAGMSPAESAAGEPDFEHHAPDRIAQSDAKSTFTLRGLVPGARYRLYGLLDMNGDRLYTKDTDFLCAADSTATAEEEPALPSVKILLVHPKEPGAIAGTIAEPRCAAWLAADTLAIALRKERAAAAGDSLAAARAESLAAADTTMKKAAVGDTLGSAARRAEMRARIESLSRQLAAMPPATREDSLYCVSVVRVDVKADADTARTIHGEADARGAFTVSGLSPGRYVLGAYRDLDNDGARGTQEPAAADTTALVRPGRTTKLPVRELH